jgi:hypothetical protein
MNEQGLPVIPPNYPQVSNFSEGLAVVRFELGKFGYIDLEGNQAIPPLFDAAHDFFGEYALAEINGNVAWVTRTGEYKTCPKFRDLLVTPKSGWFLARTGTNRFGLTDGSGSLLLDTVYEDLSVNAEGYVYLQQNGTSRILTPDLTELAIAAQLIPKSNFKNGYALVEVEIPGQSPCRGFIDRGGNLVFADSGQFVVREAQVYDDSLVVVNSEEKGLGWVNLRGEHLAFDDDWQDIGAIGKNRAWVKENELWKLVDLKGNIISGRRFKEIYRNLDHETCDIFHHGFELALGFEGWCAIDDSGELLAGPLYQEPAGIFSREEMALISIRMQKSDSTVFHEYALWDLYADKLIRNGYEKLHWFDADLDYFMVGDADTKSLIDRRGRVIWSAPDSIEPPLNITFMNRGYFYASSPVMQKYAGLGGWGGSRNGYKPARSSSKEEGLVIKVSQAVDTVFANSYAAHKVQLINHTADTIVFDAQDSRLYMNVQARNQAGQWADIEYLPTSWCGNSYHQLYLPPRCKWEFSTPVYEGVHPTEMRIKLTYKKGKKDKVIYSETYSGSVNPGQFYRKPDYTPTGIMDPYNE